jgi:hypothetical protein
VGTSHLEEKLTKGLKIDIPTFLILCKSVKRHEQGIADRSMLISLLQLYGPSLGLGFAGAVNANTNDGGKEVVRGYRALYFAIVNQSSKSAIDLRMDITMLKPLSFNTGNLLGTE